MAKDYQEQLAELNKLARTLMRRSMFKYYENDAPNAFQICYILYFKGFHLNHGQMVYERRGLKITYNPTRNPIRETPFDVTLDKNKWFAVPRTRKILSNLLNDLMEI